MSFDTGSSAFARETWSSPAVSSTASPGFTPSWRSIAAGMVTWFRFPIRVRWGLKVMTTPYHMPPMTVTEPGAAH